MKKVLLLVSTTVLALGAAQLARADVSFTDSTGDSGTAPDIGVVTAANDAVGNLTFTVRTNQSALAADAAVFLVFDVDQNAQTGSNGVEAFFVIGADGWEFVKWNGSQFATAAAPSANGSYANGLATFKISKADLGGVEKFTFWSDTLQFDAAGNVAGEDTAPNGDSAYEYALTRPLTLRASTVTAIPARPVAGGLFTVGTRVSRADNGAAMASGTVKCTARIGTATLRPTGRLSRGIAVCSLRTPKTAKGKMLRGTITFTFQGVSITKPFSYRVR